MKLGELTLSQTFSHFHNLEKESKAFENTVKKGEMF